jgi:cytoskeletal protein RodZ
MSEPTSEPTREQPAVVPTLSTAPSASRWRWSDIPSHVGPARTSTVVMAVLFVAIFALYLNVRPPLSPAVPTPAETESEQSIVPTTEAPAPPTETTAPEITTPEESTTPSAEPTPTGETPVPTPPAETTAPLPTSSSAPSTPTSSTPTSSPTTVGPPG